jgi:hypothetical protein
LDVLLYDFFGVGVLLGCLMFVVYHVLVVLLNFLKVFERHGRAGLENEYARITDTEREILEREERFTARMRNWPYNFVRVLGFYVMVTFVIGMFVRVELGLKMLGYCGFLFLCVQFCVFRSLL